MVHENDVVLWKGMNGKFNPTFNTRATWEDIREVQPKKDWYEAIWFPYATLKISLLTWLAMRNRVSTGDRMLNWKTGANTSCSLCNDPLETRNHLFLTCRYSDEVWSKLTSKLLAQKVSTKWDTITSLLTDRSLGKEHLLLLR